MRLGELVRKRVQFVFAARRENEAVPVLREQARQLHADAARRACDQRRLTVVHTMLSALGVKRRIDAAGAQVWAHHPGILRRGDDIPDANEDVVAADGELRAVRRIRDGPNLS